MYVARLSGVADPGRGSQSDEVQHPVGPGQRFGNATLDLSGHPVSAGFGAHAVFVAAAANSSKMDQLALPLSLIHI